MSINVYVNIETFCVNLNAMFGQTLAVLPPSPYPISNAKNQDVFISKKTELYFTEEHHQFTFNFNYAVFDDDIINYNALIPPTSY